MSWPAFGTNFRITGGFRKAGTSFLKRVSVMTSQLVSEFIVASRNFLFNFLRKKPPKIVKIISAHAAMQNILI
jgi:hypothetical protein